MRHAVALAGCAMLAACGAGPRPATPSAATVAPPATWRGDGLTDDGAVDPHWWRGFGDPVLAAIVEDALTNNDDIAIAAARVAEARAEFRLVRSQQLPSVGAVVAGDRDRSVNAFGMGIDQTAASGEIETSFDLDLFGRLAKASAAARAQLLASEAARDNVRLAVATTAARGYVSLCALDARLAVLRETLAARDSALQLTRRRAEAGYSSRLDLAQAEAEYAATAQLVPAAELAIAKQEDGLSVLLGTPPRDIPRGAGLDALAIPRVPVALPARMLARRPDIAAAADQLIAADRSLDSARAAFLPDIRLSAAGGAVASTLLGDPVSVFSLGGSILAPIFQGGRLRARADAAAARRDQAAFAYRKAALGAFREVEDAMATEERSQQQEAALEKERNALADALHFADRRYREGYSPYLELLDAQRALLLANLSLVQSRADRLTAAVALYQAVGGGWSPGG